MCPLTLHTILKALGKKQRSDIFLVPPMAQLKMNPRLGWERRAETKFSDMWLKVKLWPSACSTPIRHGSCITQHYYHSLVGYLDLHDPPWKISTPGWGAVFELDQKIRAVVEHDWGVVGGKVMTLACTTHFRHVQYIIQNSCNSVIEYPDLRDPHSTTSSANWDVVLKLNQTTTIMITEHV